MTADPHAPRAVTARLRAGGSVFAEDEAALLIESSTGNDDLERRIRQRLAGEPLEYIVGFTEFCGLRVAVTPGVFVPRQRTAFLVGQAVALASENAVVVDLCCGSGALGMAILDCRPRIRLAAADIEPAAVAIARINLPTATVTEGDLFEALSPELRGTIDVLVANTPYVPTGAIALMPPEARLHEPLSALDGGADGLDIQRRVAAEARDWLAPGGHLLVETSDRQAEVSAAIFVAAGLEARVVVWSEDDATIVIATRSS